MVALMESAGAFIYGCSPEEADKRIQLGSCVGSGRGRKGDMDYDEKGNRRGGDGMIGWLFMDADIVPRLARMGCTAIYLNKCYKNGRDYMKLEGTESIELLDACLRRMIENSRKDKR